MDATPGRGRFIRSRAGNDDLQPSGLIAEVNSTISTPPPITMPQQVCEARGGWRKPTFLNHALEAVNNDNAPEMADYRRSVCRWSSRGYIKTSGVPPSAVGAFFSSAPSAFKTSPASP